jgi:hypothetical protein
VVKEGKTEKANFLIGPVALVGAYLWAIPMNMPFKLLKWILKN